MEQDKEISKEARAYMAGFYAGCNRSLACLEEAIEELKRQMREEVQLGEGGSNED